MSIYDVSTSGNDSAAGSESEPWASLQKACELVAPGDRVIVHGGCYREWVQPTVSGTSEAPIVFEAAEGENVRLFGSELWKQWQPLEGGVWQATLPDDLFHQGHPFREELEGDWFVGKGRVHHRGELYFEGHALGEVEEVSTRGWRVSSKGEGGVRIEANFGGSDPRESGVEITVRPACFYPAKTGVNHITVRGFEMAHCAPPWAPPTAEQVGCIGPHWSKGWVIENNHIHHVKCSGISLGKESATGENQWTHDRPRLKHGSQREREVVFKALESGWSMENIGSHLVHNNHIHHCGQAGIVGHLGCIASIISHNHIHHVHVDQAFTGHEMAGIKLHAAIDAQLNHNHLHDNIRGIWLDWQAQGTRVHGNLMHGHVLDDLYVEVCHGPHLADHNILLSPISLKDCSQGGAYAHNLFGGRIFAQPVTNRFTPYHFPHSTKVLGVMSIAGGDNRFINNTFAPTLENRREKTQEEHPDENAPAAKAVKGMDAPFGLSGYDDCPREADHNFQGNVNQFAVLRLPVVADDNLYFSLARPHHQERGAVVLEDESPKLTVISKGAEVQLHLESTTNPEGFQGALVNTTLLGKAIHPEALFEKPDGSPWIFDRDILGELRDDAPVSPGPFVHWPSGEQTITLKGIPLFSDEAPSEFENRP